MITSPYANHALLFPEKTAIQMKDAVLTYREWDDAVRRTAAWFQALDVENKTAAIYLPNGIPFLQVFAGAAAAGWTAVPLDLKWKEEELSKHLQLAQPAVWITTKGLFPKVKGLHPHLHVWEECAAEIAGTMPLADREDSDETLPFYLGFTSGSTGSPKGFIRSHLSWMESFTCTRLEFGIGASDHVLIPGPLLHSHFLYGAMSTLSIGGTLHILEKFSPEQTLTALAEHAVSVVYVVPRHFYEKIKQWSSR